MKQFFCALTLLITIPIIANVRWMPASQLAQGEMLKTSHDQVVMVLSINRKHGTNQMYNLTVNHNHDFFIDAHRNGVLVHNCDTDEYMPNNPNFKYTPPTEPSSSNWNDMGDVIENSTPGHCIGSGCFGTVYKVTIDGKTRALKNYAFGFKLEKIQSAADNFNWMVENFYKGKYSNLATARAVKYNGKTYLDMPFVEGTMYTGDLPDTKIAMQGLYDEMMEHNIYTEDWNHDGNAIITAQNDAILVDVDHMDDAPEDQRHLYFWGPEQESSEEDSNETE